MFGTKRNTAFKWTKTAVDSLDLAGKKIAVIGGTDGLGRAVARLAAQKGAEVTVIGRTDRDPGVQNITFAPADLSLMRNAKKLGESAALSPQLDVLLFTNGIIAATKREVTPEGLERDMAVSYLSRLAVLQEFLPRLKDADKSSQPLRIFLMGFPGAGQAGKLGDLNAEKAYSAIEVHMQTVAGNEALVPYINAKWGSSDGGGRPVEAFGLNPGLIKTGIRSNFTGSGWMARTLEWLLGLTCISPETFASRILPLLFASELSGQPGLLFDHTASAILPTPALKDPEHVNAFIAESAALVDRGLAAELA